MFNFDSHYMYPFLYASAFILANPKGRYADILESFNMRYVASWVLNWKSMVKLTKCFKL